MSSLLLGVLGVTIVVMAVSGLITGKVIAGARGLQANYYYRKENPFLYYSFIFVYLAIASFILYNVISSK